MPYTRFLSSLPYDLDVAQRAPMCGQDCTAIRSGLTRLVIYRMNSKRTIVIAMLGIAEHERNILKNIFKLSSHRAQTYTVATADEPSELLIVDADDPQAMAAWNKLRSDTSKPHTPGQGGAGIPIPTVLVSREKQSDATAHCIRRPFVATRVLNVLDAVTGKGQSLAQERIIGEEPSVLPLQRLQRSYRALVIDNSKPVRKQIELELRLFGMQVDAVEAGEEALDLLDQHHYDIVFSEVLLPGIDGYQLCKSIKKNKNSENTIVIFLTSKSSPFDRIRGGLAGCDTYLIKPVKQSAFQKAVQRYLK